MLILCQEFWQLTCLFCTWLLETPFHMMPEVRFFPYMGLVSFDKEALQHFLISWDALKSKMATKNQPLYFSNPGSTKQCAGIEARICLWGSWQHQGQRTHFQIKRVLLTLVALRSWCHRNRRKQVGFVLRLFHCTVTKRKWLLWPSFKSYI